MWLCSTVADSTLPGCVALFADRKFGVKARLHRTLLLTLNLIKNNTNHVRYLQPLLQVLKLYTANSEWGLFACKDSVGTGKMLHTVGMLCSICIMPEQHTVIS